MIGRLYVVAPAAELDDRVAGAALALALGRWAATCRQHQVPWSLWLRDHGRSAATWAATVPRVAWVADLGGDIGVTAPSDGPTDQVIANLRGCGVARVHVPETAQPTWRHHTTLPMIWACHRPDQIAGAMADGATAVTLSPIWPTQSKPGHAGLGVAELQRQCQLFPLTIVALGGISATTIAHVRAAGAAGAATAGAWRAQGPALATAWAQSATV